METLAYFYAANISGEATKTRMAHLEIGYFKSTGMGNSRHVNRIGECKIKYKSAYMINCICAVQ